MVVKITAITIKRGRKYSENYQSAHYSVSMTVESTAAKDTVDDMRKLCIGEIGRLETEELVKVGDVIGVMGIEKEMMKERQTTSLEVFVTEDDKPEKLGFKEVAEAVKKNIPKQPNDGLKAEDGEQSVGPPEGGNTSKDSSKQREPVATDSKPSEEILMDLKEVTILAHTEKAILVTKKGFQKWIPLSTVDSELGEWDDGIYLDITLNEKGEKWIHTKPWSPLVVQKRGKS